MRHRFESAVIWHAAQAERNATLAALCVGAARREYQSRAEDHALAAQALCEGDADVHRAGCALALAVVAVVALAALALACLA